MSWQDATPARITGEPMSFSVRRAYANKPGKPRLVISIRPDVLRRLGWQDGERLKLQHQGTIARLLPTQGGRVLKVANGGRGTLEVSNTGTVWELFPCAECGVTPLQIQDMSTNEGLIFELPEWEEQDNE